MPANIVTRLAGSGTVDGNTEISWENPFEPGTAPEAAVRLSVVWLSNKKGVT